MNKNRFISDILSQPAALKLALEKFDIDPLRPLIDLLSSGRINRIILTGMGASYYGLYPAWLLLAQNKLPAIWIDTAELIHYANNWITDQTLLWIVSQSGRSAEILHLLEQVQEKHPAMVLATTNDLNSPLAMSGGVIQPLYAEAEMSVSTRTYINTLAITQLTALVLVGMPISEEVTGLRQTADEIAGYLQNWPVRLRELKDTIGLPERLVILGRGPSLATAMNGSLILSEAARYMALGLSVPEFRHGPLEMANERLTAIVFEGVDRTAALNRRLIEELLAYEVRAFWISQRAEDMLRGFTIPSCTEIGLPISEIILIQLLCVSLAELQNFEPGNFIHIGKVTQTE